MEHGVKCLVQLQFDVVITTTEAPTTKRSSLLPPWKQRMYVCYSWWIKGEGGGR